MMATQTPNLKLVKPDMRDNVSPAAMNTSFDILDEKITDIYNRVNTVDSKVESSISDIQKNYLGGKKIVVCTQSQYNNMSSHDSGTLYFIKE